MDLNKKRCGAIKRTTAETAIDIILNLDGIGKSNIKTKIGFFDHMLTLLSAHSLIDMEIFCDGDIEVDGHHSVEDCGIALGQAFKEAIGDKRGINRYGNNAAPPSNPMGIRVDSKRRKKLMQKRLAMGHKQDDHEQEQGYEQVIR